MWDKIVFKKIQDLLGGRVKSIITGAAPISPPVLRFLRLAFGATVSKNDNYVAWLVICRNGLSNFILQANLIQISSNLVNNKQIYLR